VLLWRYPPQLKALLRATALSHRGSICAASISSYQNVPLAYQHLHNLVVLVSRTQPLRAAGTLDPVQYADLTAQVDTLWTNIVRTSGRTAKSSWREARTRMGVLATSTCYESRRPGLETAPPRASREPRG